jgi:hypothetical protein
MKIEPAQIPSLLSAVGLINTVVSFAYSSALNRIAGIGYRRTVAVAMFGAWFAMLCLVLAYVLTQIFDHAWPVISATLVLGGLGIWLLSFPTVLLSIYLASRDTVGRGSTIAERGWSFADHSAEANFGVPALDEAIRRATAAGLRVTYPFLLIHDIDSPGLRLADRFVRAALRAREAIVYLTFSRPHGVIMGQIRRAAEAGGTPTDLVCIVDCYSKLYMPEATHGAGPGVRFADPRNPRDVYDQYMQALHRLAGRCEAAAPGVRVIYETLSDFIKIADSDLVMHYLRRVVVVEELRRVRALYIVWDGAIRGQVDQDYLRWFFSTTLELKRIGSVTPAAAYSLKVDRLFREPVTIALAGTLEAQEGAMFAVSRPRLEGLAARIAALAYAPRPYGFLPTVQGPERAHHVVNFLLFMAGIDHDTRRQGVVYEASLDGRHLHGSDLLFAMAARAKRADPSLFLAPRFANIGAEETARLFTTPDGSTPADVEGRARLFRDTARVLRERFNGDACQVTARAAGRLGGQSGIFALLRHFEAYADPIAKKSNLLAKLLMREGFFTAADPDTLRVAVDHVVMTACLRAGVVRCTTPAREASLAAGEGLDAFAMAALRETTKAALQDLPTLSGTSADRIDDLLWSYGRKALLRGVPLDSPAAVHSDLDHCVEPAALADFVAFTNGLDDDAAPAWRWFPAVSGPYTPFF